MRNVRIDNEAGAQETLFQWAEYQASKYPELKLLYHIPNGGKRDKVTAINLKRQGVKAGVPDLFLPVARGGFFGLYIELKVGKNKATALQKEWLYNLNKQGYFTAICYGWQQAAELLTGYLNGQINTLRNCAEKADTEKDNNNGWIPVVYHDVTEEEREREKIPSEITYILDCPLPENGEEIIVTNGRSVWQDTSYVEDCHYLDSGESWRYITAWQPMPKPYKKIKAEKQKERGKEK